MNGGIYYLFNLFPFFRSQNTNFQLPMSPHSEISLPKRMAAFTSADLTKGNALKIDILQPLATVKVQRHLGVVKSFNNTSGFGFIECKTSNDKYSRDVFLHKAQAGEIEVGTVVEFAIDINDRGMPQARDVKQLDGDVNDAKKERESPPMKPNEIPQPSPTEQELNATQMQKQQYEQLLLKMQQQHQQQILLANSQIAAMQAMCTPQVMYQPLVYTGIPQFTTVNRSNPMLVPVVINQNQVRQVQITTN